VDYFLLNAVMFFFIEVAMAIAANRFEFLDKETNIPSMDFLSRR
jgi:hypothetical protein